MWWSYRLENYSLNVNINSLKTVDSYTSSCDRFLNLLTNLKKNWTGFWSESNYFFYWAITHTHPQTWVNNSDRNSMTFLPAGSHLQPPGVGRYEFVDSL